MELLIKNLEQIDTDLDDVVSTSEKVQMLFNDRLNFLEICEYLPNLADATPVYVVVLWATPDRPTISQDIPMDQPIDCAKFGSMADAMTCLVDTISQA